MHPQSASAFAGELEARAAHVNASLLTICQAMGSSLELREVLPTILRLSLQEMQAQQGSILLHDPVQDKLEMLAAVGLPQEILEQGYIPRKGSIAEWVIENNQPLILNSRPRTAEYQAIEDRRKIHSSMCLPLRARGAVIGTININRTVEDFGYFLESDQNTMMILATQAAQCIENSRLHEANLKTERLAAIGQTVAGISHCIKNILTGVKGGMSLMDLASNSEDWKLLNQGKDILHRNLDRLSSIVLDMLDYSKEREPNKCENDVLTLLEEAALTVRSEALVREIELEFRMAEDGLRVQCDGQQIYRCVLNLVHNALDVTPKGGRVWLSGERTTAPAALKKLRDKSASAAIILRVGDTGPGVKAEHKLAIFDPFFSTKGSKGTGLGLAVTRKIIHEHGGHIEVESEPETPAVFAIYLPD